MSMCHAKEPLYRDCYLQEKHTSFFFIKIIVSLKIKNGRGTLAPFGLKLHYLFFSNKCFMISISLTKMISLMFNEMTGHVVKNQLRVMICKLFLVNKYKF
jgi:hypothetical protein